MMRSARAAAFHCRCVHLSFLCKLEDLEVAHMRQEGCAQEFRLKEIRDLQQLFQSGEFILLKF